jgi:pimeloyl-ACP methyl ester carboxylesterase
MSTQMKFKHPRLSFMLFFILVVVFQMLVSRIGFSTEYNSDNNNQPRQFIVERFGGCGGDVPNVILIPGLMSDGRIWQDLIDVLSTSYQVHVVNIAGFGRTPASSEPSMAIVKNQLIAYIQQANLRRPAVIGHSLGGFMAFWLASEQPEMIGKVISVDGLPFIGPVFTRSNKSTVESLANQAIQLKSYYAKMSKEQLIAQSNYSLSIQASSDQAKAVVVDMVKGSDPKSVGQAIFSLMSHDLRGNIAKIQSPTLLLGAAGGFDNQAQKDAMKTMYAEQLIALRGAKLVMHNHARHFIMLDDPLWLNQQIVSFLQQNEAVVAL